jgi:hypothetical protein
MKILKAFKLHLANELSSDLELSLVNLMLVVVKCLCHFLFHQLAFKLL